MKLLFYEIIPSGNWFIPGTGNNTIIDFAAMAIHGEKVELIQFYIKQSTELNAGTEALTGFTDRFLLENGLQKTEAMRKMSSFFEKYHDYELIGHNTILFKNLFIKEYMTKQTLYSLPKSRCFDLLGKHIEDAFYPRNKKQNRKIHNRFCLNNKKVFLKRTIEETATFYNVEIKYNYQTAMNNLHAIVEIFSKAMDEKINTDPLLRFIEPQQNQKVS